MSVTLPLDKMTVSEKIEAIEAIWENLSRSAKDVPAPLWHADVLKARGDRVKEGSAKYVDWAAAKRSIRDRTT